MDRNDRHSGLCHQLCRQPGKSLGEKSMRIKPTFMENLRYFFNYQLNHMYWRYFMWNFAGRQNDIQGNGEITHGNWISGIPFIDNARLGDQSLLPEDPRRWQLKATMYWLHAPAAAGHNRPPVAGVYITARYRNNSG